MKRRNFLCISWATFVLGLSCLILVTAEADPAILSNAELGQVQQSRSAFDPRPRLSASQQAQILSDVQQHQQRFRRPNQEHANSRQNSFTNYQQPTTPYPSLAKYKVDRTKQQQIQQLLEQQQQVQQLLLQQQQKIAQQFGPNFLQNAQTQYQAHAAKQEQQLQQQYNNPYHDLPGNYQNLQQDLSHPLFSEQHAVQLQNYLEKQRELELLQKQRQQLLLEQQELRRQQELLRLQQLRQLTSTTQPSLPPSTTTVIPVVVSTTATTPVLLTSPTARKITASETELFLKAIANHQKKYSTTTNKPTSTLKTVASETQDTTTIPENVLSLIQEQERRAIQQGKPKPQIKVIYQTDSPTTTKQNPIIKPRSSQQIIDTSDKDLLLKQLKIALAQAADDGVTRNVTTRDIILPNGKKLQVIQAPNDLSSIVPTEGSTSIQTSTQHLSSPSSTIKPPKAIFEELTKGVLPPGADFEIIRQKSDGKLEEIGKTPIQSLPAKKVTFVVLEEQPDGSYKVQGVKGNTEKEGSDVESIVEKIKKGELKLPPSSITPTTAASTSQNFESTIDLISSRQSSPTLQTITALATTFRPAAIRTTSVPSGHSESKGTSEYIPYVTVSPNSVSTTDKYVTSASSVTSHIYNTIGTVGTSSRASSPFDQDTRVTTKYPAVTRSSYVPTMAPVSEIITTVPPTIITTFSPTANSFVHFTARQPTESSPASRSISTTSRPLISEQNNSPTYQDVNDRTTVLPTVQPNNKGKTLIHESLTTLLKREGLFAMAKYLRESGLDNVLNETGPYTIFIPTDKAFRTLLVQLGGPEKAEQKFHDNPRLLSGLLLHHVIPGAFRIDSLQDEMTGVSLAGTQLRVNEYAMHDHEWNDVKVTTVNGARVAPNKRDIEIPQGIAHAIDRVMFPLPVGDLVQTLQADRERRFTIFLKMLHVSNLEHTLTGPKTFTIFAPTDAAFASSASKHGNSVWTEDDGPESAKAIVSKHIIPSTLYSAGMRYYLQKETLRPQMPLHIHKNGGRVRINEVNVVTHNVPATNGVLHAIDGVL